MVSVLATGFGLAATMGASAQVQEPAERPFRTEVREITLPPALSWPHNLRWPQDATVLIIAAR
jgi:hypothetical protein